MFTISDSHGDGICCDNGSGNYSISLDGNLLKTGDDFGFEEQTVFDVGPPGPSFSPTPAPTCQSDGASCLLGNQCCSADAEVIFVLIPLRYLGQLQQRLEVLECLFYGNDFKIS